MKKTISLIAALIICASLFACAGASRKTRGLGAGAAIGAAGGAILGQIIGGDTEATLLGAGIGAAIGGAAGHQIGAYMDRQEQELLAVMAQSEALSIRREQDILTATFKSELMFDFDSAVLKPGAYSEIGRVADILARYPQTTIRVEGHTDSKGDEDYNQKLSEKRAESVKNVMVQKAVAPTRISTIGYGESQPISSSDALNRRVSIVITPVNTAVN